MLYLKHNFYSNFSSSIESGDNEFITDMIVNETSELIVYKRDELLPFLEKIGIKLKPNSSDEKVVDSILEEMPKNVKLIKGLAFLIAQNNISDEKKIVSTQTMIKQIDMVSSGIMGISDSFAYKPQLKKEFKKRLLNIIKTKAEAVGDRNIPLLEGGNTIYWILGFLIIGTAIIITRNYLKKKKKQELLNPTKPEILTPEILTPVIEQPVIEQPVISQQPVDQPIIEQPIAAVPEPALIT